MKAYIKPVLDQVYLNKNGNSYVCVGPVSEGAPGPYMTAWFERQSDHWVLRAHGVAQYEDGTIEWDYSTDGHWDGPASVPGPKC